MKKSLLTALLGLSIATRGFATTFVVPDDVELIHKSAAIVTGVVVSARAADREHGHIDTLYEIALDRVLKGPFESGTRITIHSPGGMKDGRYTIVASSAHFQTGDEVLLFLTPHRGGWTPTDMTLGKFRFALTSGGHSVAVRDADDIVGWDRRGNVHREKIRRDAEFIQFIQDTVARRTPAFRSYEADPTDVLAPPSSAAPARLQPVAELFPAPAHTYAVSFFGCDAGAVTRYPARWETATMTVGIPFYKNAAQNASALPDGGVSVIQNALGAWTNDCGSSVNIPYGGTTQNLQNYFDRVNVVVFNDPGNAIAGSWTGSGVVATCFSSGGADHEFDGTTFVTLTDSDVVFQDGYSGSQASVEESMTHEIGHGIGFRHSDKHYLKTCTASVDCSSLTCSAEAACDANVQDCSSTAIMTSSVNTSLNYTLQQWDKNAADALYPGTCVTATAPANVVATATSTSTVNVSWSPAIGALSYNVYRSTNGSAYTLAGSVPAPTVTFNDSGRSANTAYLYKVRAVNGGESPDSNIDLATTVIFTDDPLVAGTTPIKAVHITQLRTAVNAVRTLAGLSAATFTDPVLTAGITTIKAAHITELRTALNQARSALGLPAVAPTDGTLSPSATKVKAAHVNELRNGVK